MLNCCNKRFSSVTTRWGAVLEEECINRVAVYVSACRDRFDKSLLDHELSEEQDRNEAVPAEHRRGGIVQVIQDIKIIS